MKPNVLRTLAAALVAGVLFASCGGDVSSNEARRLVEEGALLLDVRTPEEFAAGHIEGAVNVPVQELESRMAELEPKDRPIVVYCRSGNRSGQAARMLTSAGHRQVHDLGPMSRW